MPLFFHDTYLFGDETGASIWRAEHQAEHTQFMQTFLAQTPVDEIPDLDFVSWDDSQAFQTRWLVSHEGVHEQLRALTGVQGINLSDVDLEKELEFYNWLDVHRNEHTLIRQVLGIT